MNRNQFILRGAMLVIPLILIIYGSMNLLSERQSRQAYVDHREPMISLGYCSSPQVKPCILSFSLNSDGKMVINLLVDNSLHGFDLKIIQDVKENLYQCQKTNRLSTSVSCVGETLPVGKVFQFVMMSRKRDVPIAEGSFSIIGLALASPEIFLTPTPNPALKHYR